MSDLINGRTPEEIKRVLAWRIFRCGNIDCGDCSYGDICSHENEERSEPDALALIERLEAAQPKWISVEERLPEKQFRVIVRTGHNLVTTGWRSYHVDVKGGELWEVDGARNYHNDVTHWMPLPNAPEGE